MLTAADKIIANPNCSTIQLVMALAPLHRAYSVERVIVSTYQSVTGPGMRTVLLVKEGSNWRISGLPNGGN